MKWPAGDILYRVSYNNGPVHVFGWDEGLNRYAETDELADVIPPVIEMRIAEKIQEMASAVTGCSLNRTIYKISIVYVGLICPNDQMPAYL